MVSPSPKRAGLSSSSSSPGTQLSEWPIIDDPQNNWIDKLIGNARMAWRFLSSYSYMY